MTHYDFSLNALYYLIIKGIIRMSSSPVSPFENQFNNGSLILPRRSPVVPSELRPEMHSVESLCPLSALTLPFTPTQPDQRSPSPANSFSCQLLKEDWYTALQEEKIELPPNKRATMAQLYQTLWKMVSSLTKSWVSANWEVPLRCKNKTDFKSKVVRQIVVKRE